MQRGNRCQKVFFLYEDYEACERFGVRILAWCPMPNDVHLTALPAREDLPARCFSGAHTRYTRRISGRNPVARGLMNRPWEYPWSSAARRAGGAEDAPSPGTRARSAR